jgi:hypothetical protein
MVFPLGLLQGIAGAAKGILPPGMGLAGARGAAPAAGMAGQAGALAAPSANSLAVAPAPAPPVATANYTPNPYTNSTGGANAGNGGSGSTGAPNIPAAAAGAAASSLSATPAAAAPVGGGSTQRDSPLAGANINPYGAQNNRPSDWLTGGGGSHIMQGIVNRDPFAARGMEGDLGAYGINVPNTGSLKPSDVGLGGAPMSRDPYSAREAATGFGPTYGHTPTSPADAPWQGMGYGTPTPGYLTQGGSHSIDTPVAAGTPTGGYSPPMVGGTPTQGYEPRAQGPAFSGVTHDRLNAAIAAQPIAAGTPTSGYEPNLPPVAAGTPTGGYNSITSGTGGANRGANPAPAPYLDPSGVLQEVFSGADPSVAAPKGDFGGASPAPAINPFASIGDFFSPPSQAAVDRMAGGYGIAPPVTSSLPGFLEGGGASHPVVPSYGTPRQPQYRPAVPGANPRPQQSYDAPGPSPSTVPPPYSDVGGPRVPSPRPDVGVNPFGFRMPSYGEPRIPQSRPDPWSDWYDRMGGYG